MRVEAKDRKNPSLICVATIAEVRNKRLLVHFDGWSDKFDYWCTADTTDIHPPMWCGKNGKRVEPPQGIHFMLVSRNTYLSGLLHLWMLSMLTVFVLYKMYLLQKLFSPTYLLSNICSVYMVEWVIPHNRKLLCIKCYEQWV